MLARLAYFDRVTPRLSVGVLIIVSAAMMVSSTTAQQINRPTTDLLEDRLEKLTPKQPRTEADEDRLLAEAQFAYGRMLLQREQTAEALLRFQRSFRNDPSPIIAKEVMTAAAELNRHAEAVRYAILSAEIQVSDGDFAVRLAAFLAEQGENERAIHLLENATQATKPPSKLNQALVKAELLRLYLLTNKNELAAKAADAVNEALHQPDKSGLTPADQKQLKGQRDRLEPLIAESYLRVQRHADAEAVYRSLQQVRPNEALLGFQLARIAVEKKDWKSARERLESYFREKLSMAGFEPYELLARIIAAEVNDDARAKTETLTALQQLREKDPNNNALGYLTADKYLAAENLDAAAKLYEELLARQPTTTAYRRLAQIHRRKKDAPALLKLIGRALDQSSSRELLGAEGESIVQDTALFEQLVALLKNPAKDAAQKPSASAFVGIALLALGGGKVDVARELYEKALAIPDADLTKIRESIGMAALLGEQPRFAADVFSQAIAAKPPTDKLIAYHYYLAGAWEFAGETDKALVAAEKCAELKQDSVQFQSRPAWVLYHAKRLDEAEQRYRDLVIRFDKKYDSEDLRDQLRQTKLVLSNICVLKKRLPEAEEWLEQVLDEFPENIGALNDLGYLWADQGKRLNRALRMVEQAVAKDPDNAAYRDSLGWAYYRLGRYNEAVRELERAVAGAADAVIYDHLGDSYLKLDQRDKALQSWRKAAEMMKDPEEAQQLAATTAKIKQYSEGNPQR